MAVCSYGVFIRILGRTPDTASTADVVPAAQVSNDANRVDCTLRDIQEFCTNSGVAMEHFTNVSPHRSRRSARDGHNLITKKECTLTCGNNTTEEATGTENEPQHAQFPQITIEEAIASEIERYCALVQVMLHYYDKKFMKKKRSRQQPESDRREMEYSNQKENRHHLQRLKNRH